MHNRCSDFNKKRCTRVFLIIDGGNMKWLFLFAILLGASAFLLDAFFAHGLKSFLAGRFTENAINSLTTASRYQLFASIFIILTIILHQHIPSVWLYVSQAFSILGVSLFCFTMYLKYLGNISISGVAPLGGISFMLSFLTLIPLIFRF